MILGFLASVAVVGYSQVTGRAELARAQADMASLAAATMAQAALREESVVTRDTVQRVLEENLAATVEVVAPGAGAADAWRLLPADMELTQITCGKPPPKVEDPACGTEDDSAYWVGFDTASWHRSAGMAYDVTLPAYYKFGGGHPGLRARVRRLVLPRRRLTPVKLVRHVARG